MIMVRSIVNLILLEKYKLLLLLSRKLNRFDAVSAVTLDGNMCMYDISKFLKLTSFKTESEFVDSKFWAQRKVFCSSTSIGEIILNGSGNNKEHLKFMISGGDPINDFCIIDENYVVAGCEDSFIYLFDVRKGIIN